MSKSSTISALAIVNSTELKAKDDVLTRLQKSVITQLRLMSDLRRQESVRGLLVGLALLRIKTSLPHGQFGKWVNQNISDFGERYVNYLMRFSMIFVEKCHVKKPEILALPGEQTELALESLQGEERRFMEKAFKFTGDLSLNELFIKHDIKSVGLKKELDAKKAAEEKAEKPAEPPSVEQLYEQSRDEIGTHITALETLLITENRLQYLVGRPDLLGVVESLETLAKKVRKAAAPLLTEKITAKKTK